MERATVKLIKDYGNKKAGDDTTCHPDLVPILIERGFVEAEAKEEEQPKPKAVKAKKAK